MSKLMIRLTTASALAAIALSMPLASSLSLNTPALAKDSGGHGGGNGGDHGGNGNGNGNGGGQGGHGSGRSDHSGKDKGTKASRSNDDGDAEDGGDTAHGSKAGGKLSGALNAAHASATARAHAAPNSAVGRIATYERERDDALEMTDPAEREAALDDAVSDLEDAFGRKLSEAQIAEINALLDRD